jgi:hypothetical protein
MLRYSVDKVSLIAKKPYVTAGVLVLLFAKDEAVTVTAWKRTREEEVQLHSCLISAVDGGKWSASHPFRFAPGKSPPLCVETLVGPRATFHDLDTRKIS